MRGRRFPSIWYVVGSFILPAVLYWCSVDRSVASWDVGEMQTVPYLLGIAHTTGYPAFVLAGWVFAHAFAFGSVAWRMNLLGALYCAVTSCAICCVQLRLGVRGAIALLVSLLFASGTIVWSHAIRIDVLSMAAAFAALTVLLLVRWSQERDARAFFRACVLVGCSLGDHLVIIWTLPSVALYVWLHREVLRRGQLLAGVSFAAIAATCVYAYLPIRSAIVTERRYDATLALGFPPGLPYWDYGHPANVHNLIALVTGAQVHATSSFAGMLSVRSVAQGLTHFATMTFAEFSVVGSLLLAIGVWVGWRRQRSFTLYALLAGVLIALFTAAFSAESDPDRYYIVSFALLSVSIGVGASAVADALAHRFLAGARNRAAAGAVCGVLVATVSIGVYRERAAFGWHDDRWGSDYVRRVRALTPSDAVIVAPWVLASPLGYAEYVERSYSDRVVVMGSVVSYRAYLAPILRARPVYVVLDSHVPAGFRLRLVDAGDPHVYQLVSSGR